MTTFTVMIKIEIMELNELKKSLNARYQSSNSP